jgi:hypothetical protein
MNICKAFLQYPKDGGLDITRQTPETLVEFQGNLDVAPLREPFRIPPNSRKKSALVQQGWM